MGLARIHSGAVLLSGVRSRPSDRGGAPLTDDVTATTALRREAVSKPLRNEALTSEWRGYSMPDSSVDTNILAPLYTPADHVIALRNELLPAHLLIQREIHRNLSLLRHNNGETIN